MYLSERSERAVKIFKVLKQFHHRDSEVKGLKHKNNLTARYAQGRKEREGKTSFIYRVVRLKNITELTINERLLPQNSVSV